MSALTPDFLGQLFAVPEKDWTAVNKRVGEAAAAANVTHYIGQYVPEFAVLIVVCDLWREQTFERLVAESAAISRYAKNAIQACVELSNLINILSAGLAEITGKLKTHALEAIARLYENVRTVIRLRNVTDKQLADFLEVNRKVDLQLARYTEQLGIFWEPLGTIITKIEAASRLATSQWEELSANLSRLHEGSVEVTLPFLIHLEIEASLARCKTLQCQAERFLMISQNQTKYWY